MTLPTGSSSEDFCRSFYQFQCRVEVTSTFLLFFFFLSGFLKIIQGRNQRDVSGLCCVLQWVMLALVAPP